MIDNEACGTAATAPREPSQSNRQTISRREIMENLMRFLLRAAPTIVLFTLAGCGGQASNSSENPSGGASPPPPRPVRIVLIVDKSASVIRNDIQPPRAEDVLALVDLLGVAGGEFAVGRIAAKSNISLVRLRISAPPVAPERPSKDLSPLILAEAMREYQRASVRHKQELDIWTDQSVEDARLFMERVRPILDGPPRENATDIWGAIRRSDMFLAEPVDGSHVEPIRYAVLVTDGVNTVQSEKATFSKPTNLVVVNGSGSLGDFEAAGARRFESSSAAIQWIVATTTDSSGGN